MGGRDHRHQLITGSALLEVQEITLAPHDRGHGYGPGPHLTRLLAHELPDRDRVLIDTIHASKRGALEAARQAGRHDVGGWLQLCLQSLLPGATSARRPSTALPR